MPHLFDRPLAIVDVETTGINYHGDHVIDLGILRVENGQVVRTCRQLINPQVSIPVFITKLTGIGNLDVVDAPAFADMADDLLDLLDDCIFVAHNARFDYAFIKEEFNRADRRWSATTFCTVKLSRALYPGWANHKLSTLIERFHIAVDQRHRAYADAAATWQALQEMANQAKPEIFDTHVSHQLRHPTLPAAVSPELIKDLPQTPGVYIFEGDSGIPLYVGKSINIRSRVLSHFADDHRATKELRISQQIRHIRTIPTCGELGALLKESELVKELMPLHNRVLRRKSEMVLAVRSVNKEGYSTIRLERGVIALNSERVSGFGSGVAGGEEQFNDETRNPKPITLDTIMAVFRSQREAKESLLRLAKEHNLCHKLLGLQKTSGPCFAHQLKQCSGACVGKVSALEYELQFQQAFANLRIERWPFPSPIIITETADETRTTSYLFDQWYLLGTIEQNDQSVEFHPNPQPFDLDQYKILKHYLSDSENLTRVVPFTPKMATQLHKLPTAVEA